MTGCESATLEIDCPPHGLIAILTPPCQLFRPRQSGTPSAETLLCRVFEQNHPGPSEQTPTELTGSCDPCRHARRERDGVEIPNHVPDDTEVDAELLLAASGSSGGQ